MFTGIIETVGKVISIVEKGTNKTFWIASDISSQFKIDQSVSHSGVCLTVEAVDNHSHQVTAILETLEKTNLNKLNLGSLVNLEQCLPMHGRLDGHLVQGHVDTTATCIDVQDEAGSWKYTFRFPASFAALVIEKGSISLNGTSLTIFDVGRDVFSVAIIPYTYEHTSIHQLHVGSTVNIEFDMMGKYITRSLDLSKYN